MMIRGCSYITYQISDLPDLLQSHGGGQLNLLQYYMGGGSSETTKLYYVIYEQPLIIIICYRDTPWAVFSTLNLGS